MSQFALDNLVSRDGFRSPVPRQPAHLHTQAESGAYLRDSSRVSRRRPFIIYLNRQTPSSGQSRVYRVTTQLRTDGAHCRESVGTGPVVLKVVPVTGAAISQVTMDQLNQSICAPLFPHPHVESTGGMKTKQKQNKTKTTKRKEQYFIMQEDKVTKLSCIHSHRVFCFYCCFAWSLCMAIHVVSLQSNGRLLPDIKLLTLCYYHRGIRLNAMKRFSYLNVMTFFPPVWGMLRRSRCVQIFL